MTEAWVALSVLGLLISGFLVRRRLRENQATREYVEEVKLRGQELGDPRLGCILHGFLLTDSLGSGALGTVYRGLPARSLDPNGLVAMKIIPKDRQPEFERELEMCQKLNHPNIVRLLTHKRLKNENILVFEYLDGGSLRDRLEKGLSIHDALAFFDELLAGVEFAHSVGVVHCDIKPSNVLLARGGSIKLTDFGAALSESLTGTPAYLAPERLHGAAIAPSMDQYSLGAVGYQLLTGHVPFLGESAQRLVQDPEPPSHHRAEINASLDEVILRMMKRQPKERFSSVGEVRTVLRELSSGFAPS